MENALISGREDTVASQHHPSLNVHAHGQNRPRDFLECLGLLDLLEWPRTRRHSTLLFFWRLVFHQDGSY